MPRRLLHVFYMLFFAILAGNPPEGAVPLSEAGRQNLIAFTKAYGLIRFFQPNNASINADWNALAVDGVAQIEQAIDPKDLSSKLQTFFAPYAPTANFMPINDEPKELQKPNVTPLAVRWRHKGLGINKASTYESILEYSPVKSLPSRWRKPNETVFVDIGAGVRVCFYPTLYADKMPLLLQNQKRKVVLPGLNYTGITSSRSIHLGAAVVAWSSLHHFYPYFDVISTDWEAELNRALPDLAVAPDLSAAHLVLERMIASLQDGHAMVRGPGSRLVTPPPLRLLVQGERCFVAISGTQDIPAGSEILTVDGHPMSKMISSRRAIISASTDGLMRARLSREILSHGRESDVDLNIALPNGNTRTITLPRAYNPEINHLGLPENFKELLPGVYYVDLERTTDQDFQKFVNKLAKAKGVIFDIRGYPQCGPDFLRHLTNKSISSATWNIPVLSEPYVRTWDTSDRWTLRPAKPRIMGKIAFLIGGGSISYAESCVGIVEAYKLAELVGETTAGTNGNVNAIKLPGDWTLTWTGMKVLKHDGSRHHGIGISPTVPVKWTLQGLAEGRDEVLEKALEVVSK